MNKVLKLTLLFVSAVVIGCILILDMNRLYTPFETVCNIVGIILLIVGGRIIEQLSVLEKRLRVGENNDE